MIDLTCLPTGILADITTTTIDWILLASQLIGGVGIFLFGMKSMSEGMQAVAGSRLRKMISAATGNRVIGVGTGTLVTCMIQSSSITTVLVVGFVNSGLMLLYQAISVIMGANIGTTITGWILVLKIGKFGLPILGISIFFYLFSRRERWRYIALTTMGLGMIFYGLTLMKNGMAPLGNAESELNNIFKWLDINSSFGVLKCILVGACLTAVIQSSSATLAITIAATCQGVITFESAAALVLGENIGTTITAFLASLGTTTNAKRAAYFHILFNSLGVITVIVVFRWYIQGIAYIIELLKNIDPLSLDFNTATDKEAFDSSIRFSIATTHTVFNILIMSINIFFIRKWAYFLEWLVPEKQLEVSHLTHLNIRLVDSPAMGIEQSHGELVKMANSIHTMMDSTRKIMIQEHPDDTIAQDVFHREEVMDTIEREIVTFVTELMSANIPLSIADEGRMQLRVADEYESVSDIIISILKARLRLRADNLTLSEEQFAKILALHDKTVDYLNMINDSVAQQQANDITKAHSDSTALTAHIKELRKEHLAGVGKSPQSPIVSMTFTNMLANYRRIKEHALNIAEALAGE